MTYRLRPSADAILKSVSHMSCDVDPRAPTKLTDYEVNSLKTHPLIVELRERRDTISQEAQRMHGTLKKAEAVGSMTQQWAAIGWLLMAGQTLIPRSAQLNARC